MKSPNEAQMRRFVGTGSTSYVLPDNIYVENKRS